MRLMLLTAALGLLTSLPPAASERPVSEPHSSAVALQVFFPPTDPGQRDYDDVHTYLLSKSSPAFPIISGAVLRVEWSDFDLGDTRSGTHSKYDFRMIDDIIAPWVAAGKKANLVLHTTPYGGPPNCPEHGTGSNGLSGTANCAMPAWMWTVLK